MTMQAVMETIFDIVYLCTVIALGVRMITGAGERKQIKLFGIMAVVLGCGDAFHLLPRAYALCTDGLANHAAALGFGKLVTSVTMTVFYVILYYIWKMRYRVEGKNGLTAVVWGLALVRVFLCFMPGNDWLSASAPLSWGIYRNIPFASSFTGRQRRRRIRALALCGWRLRSALDSIFQLCCGRIPSRRWARL